MSGSENEMMKVLLKLQFWAALLLYTGLGLMNRPDEILDTSHDKILHFVGYILLYLSAKCAYSKKPGHGVLLITLLTYSLCIEIGQHFVPSRTFDIFDLLVNGLGLLVGLALFLAGKKILAVTTGRKRAADKPIQRTAPLARDP
jgi:VanZ family protein